MRELEAVLASCGAAFGPKLCCEYVHRPLLLKGRKFDLRLLVCVRSLAPLRAYAYQGWYAWLASAAGGGAQSPECVVDQRGASGADTGDSLRILGGPGVQ